MKTKEVVSRKVTKNGKILITFKDNTLMVLTPEQVSMLQLLAVDIPNIGKTVNTAPAVDINGVESKEWCELVA